MYNPELFKVQDLAVLREFIAEHSFATLVAGDLISHLPLILNQDFNLTGHLAKANPLFRSLKAADQEGVKVAAVFLGPQGYISPRWYQDPLNVPTWDYTAVHVKGVARLLSLDGLEKVLQESSDFFERGLSGSARWEYQKLPKAFKDKLLQAIAGFEITVTSMEGKFKLSQNRSAEDQLSLLKGVGEEYSKENPGLIRLLEKALKKA